MIQKIKFLIEFFFFFLKDGDLLLKFQFIYIEKN